MIERNLLITPIATPRGRNIGNRVVNTAEYKTYKKSLMWLLVQARIPPGPYVKIEVYAYFPFPKYLLGAEEGFPKTTKPDADNVIKGVMDSLVGIKIVKDDGVFYDVRCIKLYSVTPQLFIKLWTLKDILEEEQ